MKAQADLARTTLQLLALGTLIAASLWILAPFLVSLTWAVTVVVATWPLLLLLEHQLGDRRGPAVAVMTLALLLLLVIPLFFAIDTIVENTGRIGAWSQSLDTFAVPPPPSWIESLPLVGTRIADHWRHLAALPPGELFARISPYGQTVGLWFARQVGGLGMLLFHFLLTVVLAAILYTHGEATAALAQSFARRLAGAQGENSLNLAGQAIRSVALGVVVTALAQTTLTAIGLGVAGVPFASVLTGLAFILCIAQIGPFLVLVPTVIFVFYRDGGVWGTAFLIFAMFTGVIDNVIRPALIRRGADLPLLLIFAGVIGGLIAFGVIGLFIGPVVLAVAYTLLIDWISGSADDEVRPV